MPHRGKIYCEKLQTQRKKFFRRKNYVRAEKFTTAPRTICFTVRANFYAATKNFYISSVEPVSEVSAAGFFSSCFAPSAPISASSCSPVSNIARSSSSCSFTP